ncbi:MAG: T9SS type A sorting domain-containing protein, partial [Bacteroidota bacterium]
ANCLQIIGQVEVLEYTDPNTLVGGDTDAAFDADDEVVFMARFAGDLAPENRHPNGVRKNTRSVVVTTSGVVYLYVSRTSRNQSAGQDLVQYQFTLSSGTFPQDYDFLGRGQYEIVESAGEQVGSNPEQSFAETPNYRQEFSDRWITDALFVKSNSANRSAADLLDRRKFLFAPGYCARSEWTASVARGTIVASIDGPVRGIRVVRGFNSGPVTTRTTYFYEQDVVSVTDVRVHPVPSLMDLVDYAPSFQDATYDNQENLALRIDGRPDAFVAASRPTNQPFWEVVNGREGSVATALQVTTDWPDLRIETVYLEGDLYQQCTGDAMDRGTSGFIVPHNLPWTDARESTYITVVGLRRSRYSQTPISRDEAEALSKDAFTYYAAGTPTRRFDGIPSAGGGVEPPADPPVDPPDPPVDPPVDPPAPPADEADLVIVYDGRTATITNLGPSTSTGAVAGYRGRNGVESVDLPSLDPGETFQSRVRRSADDCVQVRAGDQADPDATNNRACFTGLTGAYPNPFNPSTLIKYMVEEQAPVTVSVFDVLGRRVALLVDNEVQQGPQDVRFDASSLASGLYLYRIDTPQRSTTGRVLLLK